MARGRQRTGTNAEITAPTTPPTKAIHILVPNSVAGSSTGAEFNASSSPSSSSFVKSSSSTAPQQPRLSPSSLVLPRCILFVSRVGQQYPVRPLHPACLVHFALSIFFNIASAAAFFTLASCVDLSAAALIF